MLNALFARLVILGAMAGLASGPASAEIHDVTIAKQYGVSFLPLMIMERDQLLEKHARAAGLGEIKVHWQTFAGGSVMNDALLCRSSTAPWRCCRAREKSITISSLLRSRSCNWKSPAFEIF